MVRVPEYTPNVSLRPAYQSGVDVRANPDHFGAGIGRGMQQAAQGMSRLAGSLQAVKDLEDETIARQSRNEYMRERDALMYDPEAGYMNTQGRNALDQRGVFSENMRKLREKYASKLTPSQQRIFSNAIETLELDASRSAMIHNGSELKKFVAQEGVAAAENFRVEALRNVNNPAMADKYLSAGLLELRELGRKQGLSPEVQDQMERTFISEARYNSALMIAEDDPIAGQEYYEKHKDQLNPDHLNNLKSTFMPLVIDEQAKREVSRYEEAVSSARRSGNVVTYTNTGAIRNQEVTERLSGNLTDAVVSVYGPGYRAQVYSGGQPGKGSGGRRTGSTRHDHGRAADVYIVDPNGKRLTGDQLAPLAQYWLARGYGGVGIEMRGGGIHLDEHTDRARTWNYVKQGGRYTAGQRAAIEAGLRGELPSITSRGGQSVAQEGGGAAPQSGGAVDLISFLDTIRDPRVRDAAMKRIEASEKLRAAQAKAENELIKTQAFTAIDQGMSPDDLPVDVRSRLGRTEMDGLWEYHNKSASGERIVTDDVVLDQLRTLYAENPDAFAQEDLFQYKTVLSKSDWAKVSEWKRTALTDQRKAREEGFSITEAFGQSKVALKAIGIDDNKEDGAKRIALFQNALAMEMEAFKQSNDGRNPNQMEIQSMINRLLLPVVLRQERSIWNPLKTPWSTHSESEGFMFEMGNAPEGAEAVVDFDYEQIPLAERQRIEQEYSQIHGEPPSRDQVELLYEAWIRQSYITDAR